MADFFLLSGLLLIVIFFASHSLGFDHVYFCLGGLGLILLSMLINRIRGSGSSQPKRFRTLRKIMGQGEDEREE